MGMKKTTSLKASFWKFLCMLLIGLIGSVIVPFSIILVGTSTGFITYADYSERNVKNLIPVIAATPDFSDVQLPTACRYLVMDKNYQMIDTSLEGDDLDRAMDYAISGKINENINKQYLLVTRENEYVVLQYYIGSQFINEWFYNHFPSPEILLYILIGMNCITVCVILTAQFAKNMRMQLSPLFEATDKVAGQNLDFEVGHSKIKEFEDVLHSFSDMKNNLKSSLEKQWSAEQLQREQIAALAHDLKTPLTVIQGNIEAQTNSLCLTKEICLHMETGADLGTFKADKLLLERAIMNVIDNALDYSPLKGTIYVEVQKPDDFLQISITDEGNGFTAEALYHAQEQFFMGNKSRTSNMHFGMGLYITSSIIKQHNGQLLLKNSDKTKGAEVIIKIPY